MTYVTPSNYSCYKLSMVYQGPGIGTSSAATAPYPATALCLCQDIFFVSLTPVAFGAACPTILLLPLPLPFCLCQWRVHFVDVGLHYAVRNSFPLQPAHFPHERPDACWPGAPLDCRVAAVCEQVAIASKGQTHQVLRVITLQCVGLPESYTCHRSMSQSEIFYYHSQTLDALLESGYSNHVRDLYYISPAKEVTLFPFVRTTIPPGSSSIWQGPQVACRETADLFLSNYSNSFPVQRPL